MSYPLESEPDPVRPSRSDHPVLHVSLLGRFQVVLDGQAINAAMWRRRKAKAIVKMLALTPGYTLHREQVLDALWPNLSPEAATNNLHVALHEARRVFASTSVPNGYLCLEADRLALACVGQIWVDVDSFEEALTIASQTSDPAHYQAAIDLYTGELLPEDRYEEWTVHRRSALHERYVQALLELAQLHEQHKAPLAARTVWQQVLRVEPACETAHVGLMRSYASTGQRPLAMRQYAQLQTELQRELDAEPDATSQQLYHAIVSGHYPTVADPAAAREQAASPSEQRHNLPIQLTSFVGRERELAEVKRLLATTRLLTLQGAGGSGKTRLALQVGQSLLEAYPDGVWLVDLTALTDERLVPQAIAAVLKLRDAQQRDITALLVEALQARHLLLILDNCEHVVHTCAQLAAHLLSRCPQLHILATSREALRMPGERTWWMPPLSLPDRHYPPPVEALAAYEAIRLFVERAQAHNPQFALTPHNARSIAALCQRLDGLPLAIELAAARVTILLPEQILARLDHSLRVLTAGSRTVAPRHQTIRATIDWSYALMSGVEQALLNMLSVFAGGWTLEAAEFVAVDSTVDPDEVLPCLSSLVDKSLVIVDTDTEREIRYRLLETIRAYAYEMLVASSGAWLVQQRHAAYYLALAEAAEPELTGIDQLAWLERLECEQDNIRAALDWSLHNGQAETAARLAAALRSFWLIRGFLNEGRHWLAQALAHQQLPPAVQAKALNTAGRLARQQSDLVQATHLLAESLTLQRTLEDQQGVALTLGYLGVVAYDQRDFARAQTLHEESLALRTELGDRWGTGATLTNLGEVARQQHNYVRSVELHTQSLAIFRELGDRWGMALASINLGGAIHLLGDRRETQALLVEGLQLYRELGDKEGSATALEALAVIAAAQGNAAQAARCAGAATVVRQAVGAPLSPADLVEYEHQLAPARAQLGAETFTALWSESRAMTLDEALDYAATTMTSREVGG